MIKVSVVMPVYNVAPYLRECLDSVLGQQLHELEVLCVDDGSTDGSLEILREYEALDSRVHVVSQENRGPAQARNRALSMASGEFVSFMDPDDLYPDPDALLVLYNLARSLECDVAGGYLQIFGGDGDAALNENWMKKNQYPHLGRLEFSEYQSPFGYQRYLFSLDLLKRKHIQFPDLRRFQDPPFCAMALYAAGHIATMDRTVYRYRKQHSRVDWMAANCIRAKHYLEGMRILLHLSEAKGYARLAARVSSDFRTVLPKEAAQVPEVSEMIRAMAVECQRISPRVTKVLYVCDDPHLSSCTNPFVSTLVSELRARGITVDFGIKRFFSRCEEYQVVHFQWPEAMYSWNRGAIDHAQVLAVQAQIRYARSIGIKTCYTRHNIAPHYTESPDVEDLYRVLESECDSVFHMGEFCQREYAGRYGFSWVRSYIVPHHLYEDYDRSLASDQARDRLGLPKNVPVLLAFGMFRHDEECRLVIDGYSAARLKIPGLRLLAPRLPAKYGFGSGDCVPDENLPLYFAAADVVMIPRRRILNSGNLPMAFYYGKPVVGPAAGNVGEILTRTGNPVWEVSTPSRVGGAIVAAFQAAAGGLGERNRQFADREWRCSAVVDRIVAAYEEPLSIEAMTDIRRYALRNNGVAPVTWAIDSLFEPAWETAMARSIQDFIPRPGEMVGNGIYRESYTALPVLLSKVNLSDSLDEPTRGLQYAFLWGNGHYPSNACVVGAALKYNAPLVICEDGWLRSADTWANMKAQPRYRNGCSVIFETRGCYYDATRVSTVEMWLNDPNVVVSEHERAEARRLIRRIVDNKLTKYNHQPIFTPAVGRPGVRKVLVVDQSYGDFAIRKGWANDDTFARMLEAAIHENPDADVLVKTHPDTMAGTRKGYYDKLREHDNVYRVTMPINPYSLMELVDTVYVCSTQLGFEALMAGKKVHVFGMPFYAGWGLTVDDQVNPRRTNKRTLEELFHIFYLRYTYWLNPETCQRCTIDESIDYLIGLRTEYQIVLASQVKEPPAVPVPARSAQDEIRELREKLSKAYEWANKSKASLEKCRSQLLLEKDAHRACKQWLDSNLVSVSFRLGRALTYIPRLIRDLVRRK